MTFRKTFRLGLLFVFSFLLWACSLWAFPVNLRIAQGGRANLRAGGSVRSEAIARMEISLAKKGWYRWIPFLEARRDLEGSSWSRIEWGAEAGFKPFPEFVAPFRWLYVGHGFHQAWVSPGRDHPEWEIRTTLDIPLPLNRLFNPRNSSASKRPLHLYALNEYTYDLKEGSGIRNELGAGVKIPLTSTFSALMGWRHVDLIHAPDMDQLEGSVELEF